MTNKKRSRRKRYFTVTEANAMLPLVRVIVRDITNLAGNLEDRQDRLARAQAPEGCQTDSSHHEELQQIQQDLELDQERLKEYLEELKNLGVELKDYLTGLVDFPCWMDGREVYLCWRQGEAEVEHWHEVDAGFTGRKKLLANVLNQ